MEAVHGHSDHDHHDQSFISKYIFPLDHKYIGLQYLLTSFVMALAGGFLAYGIRMKITWPESSIPLIGDMDGQMYNAYATIHGTIMIFFVAMPLLIAAFGNFLIPLMIGADDMAFPKLNRLSYQIFLVACILLIGSFFVPGGAASGGWTMYPPLSGTHMVNGELVFWNNNVHLGGTMWILAVALEFVSFLLGGINFVTTSLNMRTKGMGLFQLPMTIWMINVATLVFALSVGPLTAGAVMLLADRELGTGFYNPEMGGDPVLYQHLFWFFGHPEVYVVLLPPLGFMADIIPAFARKPLFAYKTIIYFTLFLGAISFVVWAHHQFLAGIDPRMTNWFTVTTIIISIPFGVMLFSLIFSLYGGSITFTTPMLFAIAALGEFLVGGVTGINLGTSGSDIFFHDTYYVIAHFHYTLFPATFFGGFAAIYYWFPKWFGRMMNEGLGKLHFWTMTFFFNMTFIPMFIVGFKGEHRRVFGYEGSSDSFGLADGKGWGDPGHLWAGFGGYREMSTYMLWGLLAVQIIFLVNFFKSWASGEKAGNNPWKATTLEWSTTSPPPHGNFDKPVTVYRGPSEYSVPGAKEDFSPQWVQ